MNKKFKLFSLLFIVIMLLIAPFMMPEVKDISAVDSNSATKKLTVTKKWINDDEDFRPSDITVHIKKTESTLKTGQELKNTMSNLAGEASNVTAFKEATTQQYNSAVSQGKTINNISSSGMPTYMWYDSGTIYYYSDADNIYLNANSQSLFDGFKNLENISGASSFNTTYVTNMAFIFRGCVKIADFSPIANWDTGNVTSLRFAFTSGLANSSGPFMDFTSFTPLANWNVQKVTDMYGLFKGALNATDVSPLKNWNVSNLANAGQMFMRSGVTNPDVLKDWNVVRVGNSYINVNNGSSVVGNFSQMFANLGNEPSVSIDILPNWTAREGSWENTGTFTPDTSPASGSEPTTTKVKDTWTEKTSSDSICSVTKSGNLWKYEFEVSNDGTKYQVWEDDVTNYKVIGKGSSSDHQTDITDSTVIKNINTKLEVTKEWINDNSDTRPQHISVHLKNSTDGSVVTSTNGGWTKSGSTWKYTFTINNPTEADTYEVWEDAVDHYDNSNTSTSKLTVPNTNRATITNTLKTHDIVLNKMVTGNLAELTQNFNYSIKFYDYDDNLVTSSLNITDSNVTQTATGYEVDLRHGGSATLDNIPEGFKYEITEVSEDYDPKFKITKTDDNTSVSEGLAATTGKVSLDEDQTVEFTNNKEASVLTGIFITFSPFLLLMVLALFGISIVKFIRDKLTMAY